MTIELTNSGENEALSDENQAIIILNSLPSTYKEVKTAIKYGRTSITLEEVISALKSKDLEIRAEKASSSNGENHTARRRPNQRSQSRENGKGRNRSSSRGPSESQKETQKCHHCKEVGHIRKN